jgi:hypothetical protein
MNRGRFAPSTTGPAHPGTLLAALLCWLDARSRSGTVLLRLEDLDPDRCRPEFARMMIDDLEWLGLDWNGVVEQSTLAFQHEAALDRLAADGVLYPSPVSRAELQAIGRRAPDGGWAYDNRDRSRSLPTGGWRSCTDPLRVRLPDGWIFPVDEGGIDLAQQPAVAFGDPVVRRRDGAIAYHLAVVVDDGAAGIDRVVRGRDLAASTATQAALQQLLGLATPTYRHHLLLLEKTGQKLAKLHGSVGAPELRRHYAAPELCGFLAWCAGLIDRPEPCTPADLVKGFSWNRVRRDDRLVGWDGERLHLAEPTTSPSPTGASPRFVWLTPPVPAALAVVRCAAVEGLLDRDPPQPGRARFARLRLPTGQIADEVVATRLDNGQLEISTHGGPGVRAAVTDCLRAHGLTEGTSDALAASDPRWAALAAAASPAAVRWLLGHPDEKPDFPADFLRRQPVILITGPVNVGKSTLLNAWCGHQRALVSDLPGTTRDLVAAQTLVAGWRLRLLDSAGLRPSDDPLENAGQDLAERARGWSDAVIYLEPPDGNGPGPRPGDLVVHGKADLRANLLEGLPWSVHGCGGRSPGQLLDAIGDAVLERMGLPGEHA